MKQLKFFLFFGLGGALALNIVTQLFRQYMRASCGFSSMFGVVPYREPISDVCAFWDMSQFGLVILSSSCGYVVGMGLATLLVLVFSLASKSNER